MIDRKIESTKPNDFGSVVVDLENFRIRNFQK